jgi:RNA polymerase sigma factor (sigma-70 family)
MQRDLVEAARAGDHDAFEALVIAIGDRLYSMARLILRDADRAEEAVQDALVRAWRQLPSLRDPALFDAWVYRLLVHACADIGRRNQRWSGEVRVLRAEPIEEDAAAILATRDQLERGFRRLRPEQRAAIVLHHYFDLAVPEVADILGVPVGTAKSRIHYAMEVLRSAIEADDRDSLVAMNGPHA